MPATAKAGEVIEVKTLISHEMETGQRKDAAGKIVPRKIIKQFAATFNGKEIMKADWHPAVSANPYQSFFVRVPETRHLRVLLDRRRRLGLQVRAQSHRRLSPSGLTAAAESFRRLQFAVAAGCDGPRQC